MAHSNADRNLLFGILALQLDFIARDALIAAMHAWVLEKSKPLGQVLVDCVRPDQERARVGARSDRLAPQCVATRRIHGCCGIGNPALKRRATIRSSLRDGFSGARRRYMYSPPVVCL